MDIDAFWELIERSREQSGPDGDGQDAALEALVQAFPTTELTAFAAIFEAQKRRACRYDIWEAGALLDGGMGDDSFKDFRSWLIGQGRAGFESVLADPDSLAGVPGVSVGDYHTDESFGGVALGAWYDRHDEEPDRAAHAAFSAIKNAHLTPEEQGLFDGAPGGDRIEWADVRRRFPRLWALAGHQYDS